jgi:hypothetical protein
MQISCDTSKLEQSLKKFHEETVRKLEGMVQIFSYWVTWEAIENTPFGDDVEYVALYNTKARMQVLKNAKAGMAKGGWIIEMNKPYTSHWFMQADTENAENVKKSAEYRSENYKLGDTVYITNNVPYVSSDAWPYDTYKNGSPVRSLEGGASSQAPNGIMEPTLHAIYGIYRSELNEYYKAS